jgi:hypothetical protein
MLGAGGRIGLRIREGQLDGSHVQLRRGGNNRERAFNLMADEQQPQDVQQHG